MASAARSRHSPSMRRLGSCPLQAFRQGAGLPRTRRHQRQARRSLEEDLRGKPALPLGKARPPKFPALIYASLIGGLPAGDLGRPGDRGESRLARFAPGSPPIVAYVGHTLLAGSGSVAGTYG